MERNIFKNISPLDHRYSIPEEEFKDLSYYLSEEAVIRTQAEVELALIKVLHKRGFCGIEVVKEVKEAVKTITPEEVYKEEQKTRHNIRALVNCIRNRVSPEARPFVHFSATSVDIMDTSAAIRYRDAAEKLILPALKDLMTVLLEVAWTERKTIQIGRTHGQHAVPITFGFALSLYISRLGQQMEKIRKAAANLRGKMAGAVGAYNASSLFIDDPIQFEKDVLAELGLKPAPISSQIVQPEYVLDFVHTLVSTFGILANFADDMRHLQRTEIDEVGEYFAPDQIGSSTMPHKRNPVNYENVKSMYKEFMPRMVTLYLDQISEHQRDLTNSASGRFVVEIIAGLVLSIRRLTRVISNMWVNREQMKANFDKTRESFIAEPLYILLAGYGHPDAHEAVRLKTLKAKETGKTVYQLMLEDEEMKKYWDRFTDEQKLLIQNPERYLGQAVEKTEFIVREWKEKLKNF
ncbi:adenylosuccinate lyase [Anoxybacter fermentans]|uniref:Adenylosuccinate lyase n=1 Tax=Anoxybacter fermentans TaxID=1323375 RepID=A0A3Q9HRQ0_9FIRM|nr:adenylosuccinate lyase [Anoxybacter fermentans]